MIGRVGRREKNLRQVRSLSLLYCGTGFKENWFCFQVLCAVANNIVRGRLSDHGAASFSQKKRFLWNGCCPYPHGSLILIFLYRVCPCVPPWS